MAAEAPQIPCAMVGETLLGAASFAGKLDSGELLTGTPTVTELTSSDLTISNVAVNAAALTINGATVAIGEAVQFLVSGHSGDTSYRLRIECGTDSSPAQTLRGIVKFRTSAAT